MLDFQIVQAPMRYGLAEGVDPHQVPFGTLTQARNACWSKSGCIQKRDGARKLSTSIVGGGTISAGSRLFTRGDELGMTDGLNYYVQTSSGWVSRGAIPNIGITWATMTAGLDSIRAADISVSGSTMVEAWVSGDPTATLFPALVYRVLDASTLAIITPATVVKSAGIPESSRAQIRLLSIGSNSWILYGYTSGGVGKLAICPIGGVPLILKIDAATGSYFGLDAIVVGSSIVVAYTKTAGIGLLTLDVSTPLSPTISITSSVTGETSASVSSISLCGQAAEALFVAYATSNDVSGTDRVRFACANISTLAQTLAPTNLYVTGGTYPLVCPAVACARYTTNQALICYHTCEQSIGTANLVSQVVTNTGSLGISGGSVRTFGVLSRPTLVGSRWVITAANYSGEPGVGYTIGTVLPTSELVVLDVTPNTANITPVQQGKIEVLTGAFWAPGYTANSANGYVPTPFADGPAYGASNMTNRALVGARRTLLTAGGGADMWRSIPISNELCVAAGMLSSYDGVRVVGYGFATGPLMSTVFTSTSTTGGTLAAGTYTYNVTTERRSASGLLYRSPVGLGKRVTTTGTTSSNSLGIIGSSLDYYAPSPGAHLIYRTVVNGLVQQRLAIPPGTATLSLSLPLSTALTDAQSDALAGLSIRPALYTEGGELEDMQPPSAQTLAYHQHRVWLISGDGYTLWFSKDRTLNPEIAPGFHPSQTLVFDYLLTALAVLDDKLVVFAKDRAWIIVGNGPDVTGNQGSYDVVPIQTDVGCMNPRSVVSMPDGIMFQSERGLYMLTRALEMQWIGRPIQDEVAGFPNITSAVLVADKNEIRFTANNSGPSLGCVLVYNYVEAQWTTSRYFASEPIADACMWKGQWTALTTAGDVFYETSATQSLDINAVGAATWVPLILETAWISATGPLAYQSVRNFSIEGVATTPHTLTISVTVDGETSYAQTKAFSVTAAGAESYDLSIGTRRKCRAIRFLIQDAAYSGDPFSSIFGQGLSLSMIGIEVGQKKGLSKKPANRTG